jgi:hypothetical protein
MTNRGDNVAHPIKALRMCILANVPRVLEMS